MLLSMTGYGRSSVAFKEKTISVEVKSLNSKFTDLRIKIPQNFREKETELRKMVVDRAERGKLELSIEVKSLQGDDGFGLNRPLFKRYYQELQSLLSDVAAPQSDLVQAILKIPNVISTEEQEIDDDEWSTVMSAMTDALSLFDKFRLAEGGAMEEDLRTRVSNILDLLGQVNPFEEERVSKIHQRMYQNLEEFMGKENVDKNRFEQEVLFYLEKMDITEEKVRLEQHCRYFLEELDKKVNAKGRKLGFISQEMGREINTLGAKAYSSEIQRLVVTMKDELEKIKELVANTV